MEKRNNDLELLRMKYSLIHVYVTRRAWKGLLVESLVRIFKIQKNRSIEKVNWRKGILNQEDLKVWLCLKFE